MVIAEKDVKMEI